MQTTWRTRSTSSSPLLYALAAIAIGALLWSLGRLRDGKALEPLTFDVPPSDPVAIIIHNTHRYAMSPGAAKEFEALLPPGGHLVHLGSPPRAYTPVLLHQMKCLEIIHAALIDAPPDDAATPTPLVSHCLNYLRQSILCRPNLRLESVMNANASSEKEYETVCRNWESVYVAAEKNQAAFAALQEER